MESKIQVENIKCGGCMKSIKKKLESENGVESVEIDDAASIVSVFHDESESSVHFERVLSKMGYPPAGKNNLGAKAKSYVSCMVGRMDD